MEVVVTVHTTSVLRDPESGTVSTNAMATSTSLPVAPLASTTAFAPREYRWPVTGSRSKDIPSIPCEATNSTTPWTSIWST